MNTNVLARLVAAAAQVTPLAPVAGTGLRSPDDDTGRLMRGQVLARLADGSFRVLVEGTPVRVAIAGDPQPGDAVELRLPLSLPRPIPSPSTQAPDVEQHVSTVGRALGQLLEQEPAQAPRQSEPIVSTPPRDARELAQPLARAVERSGLFYEAHQARWSRGEFPLAKLLEEPQGKLRPEPGARVPVAEHARTPALHAGASPQLAQEQPESPDTTSQRPLVEPREETTAPAPIAREALALVRQQIESLEAQRIVWHGEVWPGQPMRWEIHDERDSPAARARELDWSTNVSLDLPALGAVQFEIRLAGSSVSLALRAQDSATARSMRAEGPALEKSLAAAGLLVRRFEVGHHERAP